MIYALFLDNANTPKFKQQRYKWTIKSKQDEKLIEAEDPDSRLCRERTPFACPCGIIYYSINSGNDLGLFNIDKTSGLLSYTAANHLLQDAYKDVEINLVIEAKNRYRSGDEFSSTTKVTATFNQRSFSNNLLYGGIEEGAFPDVDSESHHRSKRDASPQVILSNCVH